MSCLSLPIFPLGVFLVEKLACHNALSDLGFMAGSDHPPLRGRTLPHCKAAPDLIYGCVPPLLLSLLS
ncbi:hypothetical protein Scep_003644 [Stephania cephalantha]|uniref:Uncharacterized protein n=1 Tax=Stephania cephalantha TaxID=152367 RepID=A0AAP0KRT9_9MAGN